VVPVAGGRAVLSTWRLALDLGRGQDGEPFLAGTAHRAHARLSPATAAALGVVDGGLVAVSSLAGRATGSITLPVVLTPMPDGAVWLPTNSAGSRVRVDLAATSGDVVGVTAAAVAPPAPGGATRAPDGEVA
jgi:NADH-quinone oxidoreductase subunit G